MKQGSPFLFVLGLILPLFFCQCQKVPPGGNSGHALGGSQASPSYRSTIGNAGRSTTRATNYVFIDEARINDEGVRAAKIVIDLSDQRARVYDRANTLLVEAQVSTGRSGFSTPTGSFRILEKKREKRSNRYGSWVDAESGSELVSDGDSRKPPGNAKARFVGADMPYWTRLTWGGVGMHVGEVPNFPASHGCIRVAAKAQPVIFQIAEVGTPVTVQP